MPFICGSNNLAFISASISILFSTLNIILKYSASFLLNITLTSKVKVNTPFFKSIFGLMSGVETLYFFSLSVFANSWAASLNCLYNADFLNSLTTSSSKV